MTRETTFHEYSYQMSCLWDLRASDFVPEEIARSLAGQARFNARPPQWYSVAQHAVAVGQRLERAGEEPAVCLAGLVHDVPEGWLGDIPKPLRERLEFRQPGTSVYHPIDKLEHRILERLAPAWGLVWPFPESVWQADREEGERESDFLYNGGGPRTWERVFAAGVWLAELKRYRKFATKSTK